MKLSPFLIIIILLINACTTHRTLNKDRLREIKKVGLAPAVISLATMSGALGAKKAGYGNSEISESLLKIHLYDLKSINWISPEEIKEKTVVANDFDYQYETTYLQNLKRYDLDAIVIYSISLMTVNYGYTPQEKLNGILNVYDGKTGELLFRATSGVDNCSSCNTEEKQLKHIARECVNEFKDVMSKLRG